MSLSESFPPAPATPTDQEVEVGLDEELDAADEGGADGADGGADSGRDAAEVGAEASRAEWAQAAREELLETAGHYHQVITLKELAAAVQDRTDLRTTQPLRHWIGDVLTLVAQDCASRGEPLLSALAVDATGSVGEVYAQTVLAITGTAPADPDDHAAAERLACYRAYDAVGLPSHGGTKALTDQLSASRTRARKRYHAEKAANVCPTCQMALPATGECDNCS